MKILAALQPAETIRKIVDCLGLPSGPPPIASAMPDPEIDEPGLSWAAGRIRFRPLEERQDLILFPLHRQHR